MLFGHGLLSRNEAIDFRQDVLDKYFAKTKKLPFSTISDVLVVKFGFLAKNVIDSSYRCHFRI